ncbi:MAG: glycosyltransferase family 61 protein [Bradyrhizobiaceae bacterium]|nr:MAG: glycosyltransferase family 61 protein [Bradyrhizobiaceae bacterium]
MDQKAIQRTAESYSYLKSQFLPEERHPLQFGVIAGAPSYASKAGVLDLKDALVFSGEWLVVTTGRVHGDLYVQTPRPPKSAFLVGDPADTIHLICEQPSGSPIERAFLLGGCRNYCHWLLDYLPRLFFDTDASLPILVNDDLAAFQRESLEALGVDTKRLMGLRYPRTYHVKNLLLPSLCSSSFTPPFVLQPWVVEWIRNKFASHLSSDRPGRRIFISRAGQDEIHQRRLINHDEIVEVAKAHDFEIVRPETMSFSEQISLFSQAGMIAGPHGAGFANMVFAPKSARIIEMLGPHVSQNETQKGFMKLGAILQQQVTRLVGEGRLPIKENFVAFETYTIDPGAFAHELEAAARPAG